jgi:hypothetical protein
MLNDLFRSLGSGWQGEKESKLQHESGRETELSWLFLFSVEKVAK